MIEFGTVGAARIVGHPTVRSPSAPDGLLLWLILAVLALAVVAAGIYLSRLVRARPRLTDDDARLKDLADTLGNNYDLVLRQLRGCLPPAIVDLCDSTRPSNADQNEISRLLFMFGEPRDGELNKHGLLILTAAQSHIALRFQNKELKRLRKRVRELEACTVTPDQVTIHAAKVLGGALTLLFAFAGCVFAAAQLLS